MTTTAAPVRPATAPGRLTPGTVVAAIAIAAAVTAVIVAGLALRDTIWWLELDFKVYHATGSAVLHGVSPFDAASADGFLFIYPPFAALIFAPLGMLNLHVAYAVWTFVNVLALEAAVWVALGLVEPGSPNRRARLALLATVAALPTIPAMMHLAVGQINVLLMLLVIADLARRPGRFQGVAVGIAAGIKLTPLIFVAYLLFTRRSRAAAVSAVTFAATVLVGFLVFPGASARWWTGLVVDTGRMTPDGSAPFNQSIRGVFAQLPGALHAQWLWLTLAVVVGLAGLAVAAWAGRRGLAAAGIMACALTGLVVSPVSWPHHWVWVVPGLALWLWWARHRRSPAHLVGVTLSWLLVAAAGVLTLLIVVGVPNLALTGVLMPGSLTAIVLLNSLTVLVALGFLGALAVMLWRADRQSTSDSLPGSPSRPRPVRARR